LPYVSWAYVHEDFGNIYHTSMALLEATVPPVAQAIVELSYWLYPVSSALFFIFFGLGDESISTYREWGRTLGSLFRRGRKTTVTDS
jgi:hypothetical protein